MSSVDQMTPGVRGEGSATCAETRLNGIYEISKILTRPGRIEITLSNVLNLLGSFLDIESALIVVLDSEDEPRIVVGAEWEEDTAKRYFERLPELAVGKIVTSKMPLVVRDLAHDPLFRDWIANISGPDRHCAFVGVPIKDHDRVVGILSAECHYVSEPSMVSVDEEVRFLTMIANLVGQTISLQTMIARDRERLMSEQHRLEKKLEHSISSKRDHKTAGIIGESEVIRLALDKIRVVARSKLPVLLRGESGTGKELFAQAIHDLSPRRNGPCIKVNCAALPETVLESELFGHEKGAFTGAIAQRKGRFELADRGTLFLDEIGDISAGFQAKLLRVLQEGEFERVGGSRTLKVDVRLVAATNCNLEAAVTAGDFRADLYYRISVVPILLPPLRDRREDIPLLARMFLNQYNKENGVALTLGVDAVAVLQACDFPGNVRELESCVRRTAAFAHASRIAAGDFACRNECCLSSLLGKNVIHKARGDAYIALPVASNPMPARSAPSPTDSSLPPDSKPNVSLNDPSSFPNQQASLGSGDSGIPQLDEFADRERLIQAMEKAGWVQAKAARLLGLTPRQIGWALRKYRIDIKRF